MLGKHSRHRGAWDFVVGAGPPAEWHPRKETRSRRAWQKRPLNLLHTKRSKYAVMLHGITLIGQSSVWISFAVQQHADNTKPCCRYQDSRADPSTYIPAT